MSRKIADQFSACVAGIAGKSAGADILVVNFNADTDVLEIEASCDAAFLVEVSLGNNGINADNGDAVTPVNQHQLGSVGVGAKSCVAIAASHDGTGNNTSGSDLGLIRAAHGIAGLPIVWKFDPGDLPLGDDDNIHVKITCAADDDSCTASVVFSER